MKTKQFVIVILFFSNALFAQSNIISSFKGTQLNQTIYLNFTIIAGQTCNGIIIERSIDSLNFSKIGEIAGVCGSISTPVDYAYSDSLPIPNAHNYYRLMPGNADWSEVIKVYFKAITENEFLIYPNPFITSTTISFQNPLRKIIRWKIYDLNGKQVKDGNTNDDSITLYKDNLYSGIYFLHLLFDNNDFQKAKLVIEGCMTNCIRQHF